MNDRATRRLGPIAREIIGEWRAAGCTVKPAGSGHFAVLDSCGERVGTVPSSPSDQRAVQNARADVRRYLRERSRPTPTKLLGDVNDLLRDLTSVSSAAVAGLPERVEGGDAQISALRSRLAEIETQLAAVSADVAALRQLIG